MSLLAAPILLTTLIADATPLERRLWEVQIRKFERLDREQTYPTDSVLFFGSSSIRRWDNIAADMAPYPVIQRGYGGARLSDAVGYVERVVYPHQFDALVLFIANDLQGLSSDRTPAQVAALFGELLAKVRAKFPSKPVFWVEVTPTPSRWHAYDENIEAGEMIREICATDVNAHFLDTAEYFLLQTETGTEPRAELFKSDMLHLNDEGYRIWTRLIREELDRVLRPSPNEPNGVTSVGNPVEQRLASAE